MPYKKGEGGRKLGAKNIQPPDDYVKKALKANPEFNPFLGLIEFANSPTADDALKLSALKEFAKYMAPQLKSVEVSAHIEGSVVIGAMIPHFNGPQPPTEKLIDESTISFL